MSVLGVGLRGRKTSRFVVYSRLYIFILGRSSLFVQSSAAAGIVIHRHTLT